MVRQKSSDLLYFVNVPKIWQLGPKITSYDSETAVLDQNKGFYQRMHLNLYILQEKSDIFEEKVSLWGYFHRP